MDFNGRYHSTIELIKSGRESTDGWRIAVGMRLAQMERVYGSGLVDQISSEVNMARSTLYEYEGVARFVVRWLGLSARRTFELYPFLTYSHIRTALRFMPDFEDQIEALLAVDAGDANYPEYVVPMSVDAFQGYLLERLGKPPARRPHSRAKRGLSPRGGPRSERYARPL